jgi:hypothetical protein
VNKHAINKQFLARSIAVALIVGSGTAWSTVVDEWNRTNVVTDLPNWPPGVEPSHVPGVYYDSTLYTDTTKLETNGAVIWKEGAVVAPGATVLTESPAPGDNCIITSGTNRAVPGAIPKTCTDEFQSAKRVKLEARKPGSGSIDPAGITLTDGKPLDMVFDVSDPDGVDRAYRVFKKYINRTARKMAGFVVELGFGTGNDFVPSTTGDGLRFSPRQQGQNPNIPAFDPLPFYSTAPGNSNLGSLMSAGLFGDAADNQNRTIDGYFGLPNGVAPWTDPNCDPDPSGTGRSYYDLVVQDEDRIETVDHVQGLHFCLFGNTLPQGQLPLGFFWDPDGDPVTDADTIADWDGTGQSPACGGTPCWETYVVLDTDPTSPTYGDPVLDANGNFTRPANPPVAVPQDVIDFWVANPEPPVYDPANPVQFYFITELDDMGLVNNNYWITVEGISTWPTYVPQTGSATFTMRTSNIGEGTQDFAAPWLAVLPPELPAPPPASDVSIALNVAAVVQPETEVPVGVTVTTAAREPAASGHIEGLAIDPATGKAVASLYGEYVDLAAGASQEFIFNWLVNDPTGLPPQVLWSVNAVVDGGDTNTRDNTDEAMVQIAGLVAVDMEVKQFKVDKRIKTGRTGTIKLGFMNNGPDAASGLVRVTGSDSDGNIVLDSVSSFTDLAPKDLQRIDLSWVAPDNATEIVWTAEITAEGDIDLSNNSATATTTVVD